MVEILQEYSTNDLDLYGYNEFITDNLCKIKINLGSLMDRKNMSFKKLVKKINRWNKPSYTNYKGWFQFDLKSQMESIVLDRKTLSRGFFNKKGIQNLLYEHYHTEKNHARLIWQIINLEYFFRNFID